MRHARLKPVEQSSFMHIYNRVAGTRLDLPFQAVEKAEFVRRLVRLSQLYVVEIVAYQVMGNHFHLLVYIPALPPSLSETCARFNRFFPNKPPLTPESAACVRLAPQLRDISLFMKDLQQPFTRWFNRTRPVRRRGHLWADRFKNTVLECGLAVWDCWKYIEMNPVRAGLAPTPADYGFGSFGQWTDTGRHPYAEVLEQRLLPRFRELLQVNTTQELRQALHREFTRIQATTVRVPSERLSDAMARKGRPEPFTTQIDRRVRYWVDGLVIGSECFVQSTVATMRTKHIFSKRRLSRAVGRPNEPRPDLVCYKHLRALLD
ncbi:MAG: hypothetical protein K8T26_19045 [Lentisphaerae bacterium]|nr:hypothetical protein [Lentisphaerota bacterium]